MRKDYIVKLAAATAVALMFVISGCRVRSEMEAADFVFDGWKMMDEQNYRAAIENFAEGALLDPEFTDAWNGLGWAYGRLGIADSSILNFTEGVNLEDPTYQGTEVLAGRSFPYLALGEYNNCITDAKRALVRSPGWVFSRDPSFTYEHLTLNIATAFFGLGHFDSSLVWVQRLDHAFHVDVATLPGRSQLAIKLEALIDEF
ncbi:MAG: hypothetical protein JSU61_06465 [Fidelibacterota bacterium]|nr:MAG: hypothetical protein JSU61_06465 [Candidatus Neomarinimicrobiota bacterium]